MLSVLGIRSRHAVGVLGAGRLGVTPGGRSAARRERRRRCGRSRASRPEPRPRGSGQPRYPSRPSRRWLEARARRRRTSSARARTSRRPPRTPAARGAAACGTGPLRGRGTARGRARRPARIRDACSSRTSFEARRSERLGGGIECSGERERLGDADGPQRLEEEGVRVERAGERVEPLVHDVPHRDAIPATADRGPEVRGDELAQARGGV